jgi:hypothetical protein
MSIKIPLISSRIEPATSLPQPTAPPHADERVDAVNKSGSNQRNNLTLDSKLLLNVRTEIIMTFSIFFLI